jgi:hypothetical protein
VSRLNRKILVGGVLLGFIIIGCERQPLSTQGQSKTPLAPKVIVEKEKVERTQPLPREVKIKLKKDGKESYSWELSGSDVDQILKINEELKKRLERDQSR